MVYVGVPVLGGLGIGLLAGLGSFGIAALGEAGMRTAAAWGVGVWCVTAIAVSGGTYVWRMFGWAGPRDLARLAQPVIEDPGDPPGEEEERPWQMMNPLPRLPSGVEVEQVATAVEPAARDEIRRLYDFVVDAWRTQDVSQGGVLGRGWRRKDWDFYIGGSRSKRKIGTESGKGLLARANVVAKYRGKWMWMDGIMLEDALSINGELRGYADARAELVKR
jgi:hypothetical protein